MQKRSRILSALLAVASGLALGAISTSASATPSDRTPSSRTQVFEMKRGGVNHEIAEAHGYEVRVDANGMEYPVKKGEAATLGEIVTGSCGTSWIRFTAVDTAKNYTSVYTGFQLFEDMSGAVYVDWNITIVDRFGVTSKAWHDPASLVHFWSKVKPFTAGGNTSVRADVVQPSIATLWDGTICFSSGPYDTVNL